jgi:hypothetical protein
MTGQHNQAHYPGEEVSEREGHMLIAAGDMVSKKQQKSDENAKITAIIPIQ